MSLLVALSTVCALCVVACASLLFWCARMAQSCIHSESRLLTQRGRIVALETSLDALDAKVRKLHGRISAEKRWEEADARAEGFTPQRKLPIGLAVCENYVVAQKAGPSSPAASCECGYCSAMRAERERFRAQAKQNGANLAALKAPQ